MRSDQVMRWVLAITMMFTGQAMAEDWPQWRGPDRDGKVAGTGFDPEFTKDAPAVLWTADLGVGFTGVTVADGRAFTAGWDNGQTTFYAFDADSGRKLWDHSFPTKKFDNLNVGGPSGTPAVDGDRVYHMARDGKLVCYKTTGGVIWEKDLAPLYRVKVPTWGFSGSPVIIGDVLYLDIGRIVALNKNNGREIWKTRDFGPAYSTPAPFTYKNKNYLAVFPATGLYIVERDTGNEVAHFPWKTSYDVHAATPVILGAGDKIFMSSDYNTGCALLEFDGRSLQPAWENKNLRNQMCTSVYHDGVLYGFNASRLTAIDATTGQELWNRRGLGKGTVIMAGEHLIVLSDSGELLTAKASKAGFNPIGQMQVVTNDNTVWTAPTLANGKLYVRGSRGKLVCLDVGD